jgi:hypothetical protein
MSALALSAIWVLASLAFDALTASLQQPNNQRPPIVGSPVPGTPAYIPTYLS